MPSDRFIRRGDNYADTEGYMSALCGKIYNKRMRNIYDEMCLRGKPKMVAIGALMRKLVHWCYGVLKTGIVFNDEGLKQVLST